MSHRSSATGGSRSKGSRGELPFLSVKLRLQGLTPAQEQLHELTKAFAASSAAALPPGLPAQGSRQLSETEWTASVLSVAQQRVSTQGQLQRSPQTPNVLRDRSLCWQYISAVCPAAGQGSHRLKHAKVLKLVNTVHMKLPARFFKPSKLRDTKVELELEHVRLVSVPGEHATIFGEYA